MPLNATSSLTLIQRRLEIVKVQRQLGRLGQRPDSRHHDHGELVLLKLFVRHLQALLNSLYSHLKERNKVTNNSNDE